MSLADNTDGQQTEQLAVLFCDLSHTQPAPDGHGSDLALWRVNYFRTAREMATDHGGREATTAAGGWIATLRLDHRSAGVRPRAVDSPGWRTRGPSLSGGLSAGEVVRRVRSRIAGQSRSRGGRAVPPGPPSPGARGRPPQSGLVGHGRPSHSFASAWPDGQVTGPLPSTTTPRRDGALRPIEGGATSRHGSERSGPLRLLRSTTEDHDGPPQIVPTNPPMETAETADANAATPAAAIATETDTTELRLSVLGWVQLEGAPATTAPASVLRGCQARAVLCMLALRQGPVHKDELAELLWPRGLPDHWDGALRGLITKIRRFLDAGGLTGRDTLVGEDGYYELRLPAGGDSRPGRSPPPSSPRRVRARRRSTAQPTAAEPSCPAAATILERRLLAGPDNAWFDQVRAEWAMTGSRRSNCWPAPIWRQAPSKGPASRGRRPGPRPVPGVELPAAHAGPRGRRAAAARRCGPTSSAGACWPTSSASVPPPRPRPSTSSSSVDHDAAPQLSTIRRPGARPGYRARCGLGFSAPAAEGRHRQGEGTHMGETTELSLSDEGFSEFDIEELTVFDVNSAVALPEMGASTAHCWFCCSSSSSSSCCV